MREEIHGATSNSGHSWEVGADGIAEIRFDTPGERVNLISPQTLAALDDAISFLERQEGLRGAIILSLKPRVFIAGADVKLIAGVKTFEEGRGKSLSGQLAFGHLERLPCPTVAAIGGACLGGGLELALACRWRVAADSEEVRIGLPEVKLGIIPGWGGTQRLPRRVGLPAALDLILSGRTLDSRAASRLGLVDAIVPPERLLAEARRLILAAPARTGPLPPPRSHAASTSGAPASRPLAALQRLMSAWPARAFILSRAATAVKARTGGHYPAPAAAIDSIATGLSRGIDEGLRKEAEHVGRLVTGDVSRNLVRIFLATRSGEDRAASREIREVAVLGAGVMGAAIAGLAASKGFGVRLRDVAPGPLEKGMSLARRVIQGDRKRPQRQEWVASRLLKLRPSLTLAGFAKMDFVLEAIVEDLGVKQRSLAEIEERVGEGCILATNTSSIPVGKIAAALMRPESFVGLHFFNPAEKMPLVEVVRGPRTGPAAVEAARAFAAKLGKTPVVVGDAPGFVVNRLLMPYLSEAMQVFVEGGDVVTIDRTLKRFGMPMGPLALLDQIGIDVAAKVAGVLEDAFSPAGASGSGAPRRLLEAMAAQGWLGAKSGRGFYVHQGRSRKPSQEAAAKARSLAEGGRAGREPGGDALVRRLLYPIVNEAARVLDERIASDAASLDVAMVFGTGFPPFLGGPLRWADGIGLASIVKDLEALAATHGTRLAPTDALRAVATGPGRFHSD